jgi:hypothetical protein
VAGLVAGSAALEAVVMGMAAVAELAGGEAVVVAGTAQLPTRHTTRIHHLRRTSSVQERPKMIHRSASTQEEHTAAGSAVV